MVRPAERSPCQASLTLSRQRNATSPIQVVSGMDRGTELWRRPNSLPRKTGRNNLGTQVVESSKVAHYGESAL